jgi:signal transduction histidine kinase
LGGESRELIQSAKKEVDRLATIARETLAPHRSSGEKVRVKASDLMDASLESFHRQLDEGHVRVERHYMSEAVVEVISRELRQVFTNLISNALDAMPGGGLLILEAVDDGQEVKLIFSDTGTGINAERLKEIFEPFVTTKGEKGLGIGLWISRNIVEKQGGTIQVRSSIGSDDHGTQFTICLPVAQEARNRGKIRLVS